MMADEKDLQIEEGGGKSKKMLFIIIAVVVLAAGGGGAFFMMSGDEPPPQEETLADTGAAPGEGAVAENTASAEMGTALYVGMPRPFVFNVPGASRDRLVQIKVQLLVRGDANEEATKKHIPLIEGALLGVFATSNADELSTSAGKESLRTKALKEVQDKLIDIEGNKVVERVLFTGFVMQ